MGKRYGKSTLTLQGFDDFLEKLQEAGKKAEVEGRKCFEECSDNLYDELYSKSQKAGLDSDLLNKISKETVEVDNKNIWRCEVGWKKTKPTAPGKALPDTYKVLFLNYGTPSRRVKEGGQRIQIDGTWVTLKENRGAESGKGFIKKAKLAAATRNKKLQKETLEKIIGELKK